MTSVDVALLGSYEQCSQADVEEHADECKAGSGDNSLALSFEGKSSGKAVYSAFGLAQLLASPATKSTEEDDGSAGIEKDDFQENPPNEG